MTDQIGEGGRKTLHYGNKGTPRIPYGYLEDVQKLTQDASEHLGGRKKYVLLAAALAGLGALVAIVSTTGVPNKVQNKVISPLGESIVYDQPSTGARYQLRPYRIKHGDRLHKLVGGNQRAVDYVMLVNNVKDPANLKPGDTILLPEKSDSGQTLDELFDKLIILPRE